jgi:prophage tail gpP-like protein
MGEIGASFDLTLLDVERARRAFPASGYPQDWAEELQEGQPCTLAIDGEVVLTGHIEDLDLTEEGEQIDCRISGRDRTGDLVDCAALPDGPAEFGGLTLDEIARRICAPYGIRVIVDTDVGAPLPKFSIDAQETALSALEKAARQRAVLLVSDGLGGLLLTRGGRRRAPAELRIGELLHKLQTRRSTRGRFSDYYVKGQTPGAAGGRAAAPALDRSAVPLSPDDTAPTVAPARPVERSGVVMTGHARDAGITRYRPRVALARTQSGGASVQQQADWQMRVARGQAENPVGVVLDWRAGAEDRLWRPNELVLLDSAYAGILGDMLIKGVAYHFDDQGLRTELSMIGPEAFELLAEGDDQAQRRGRQRKRQQAAATDRTAVPLQAGS